MPFKSLQPDIDLPTDITLWDWLFDSKTSPLAKNPASELRGYTKAITHERIDYAQVKECTTYLSTALVRKYGLKEGQTVALFSPNTIWYPVAMLGTLRAGGFIMCIKAELKGSLGGVVSGASPAYSVEEMTYALRIASARFLMTLPSSMGVARTAAKNAGIPEDRIFLLEGEFEDYTTMKQLLEVGKSYGPDGQVRPFKIPTGKKNGSVCGFLSFSSGTTGLPKAVMISHQNVIAQCLQMVPITPSDHRKVLAVLPLFHITGLVHGLHLPIVLNAEVYMLPTFTMESMLNTVTRNQIFELLLVPPILIRLVRDPLVSKYDLSCIRRFSTGAAPVSKEIIHQLQEKFPQTGFKQGYGMTESCSCITAHPPSKYDYKYAHTVGTVVASTSVKIVSPGTGKEVGVNKPGELLTKGPQCTMGYLNNEKATRETFDEEGWLHLLDAIQDRDEALLIYHGLIARVVKVKGIGVAPAELEDLLLGHEKVEDCAVMGVPDDYSGEKPKAFIVLKQGFTKSGDTGKELIDYVRERKTRHKWISEVEFVDEIPKSASGKILRRVLRDRKTENGGRKLVRDDVKDKAKL